MDSEEQTAHDILATHRTFAVVGASPNASRDSHRVSLFLRSKGYRVIPVNPGTDEVFSERCYADLASIPEPVDVVDIFRRSELAGVHVDEAIAIGAKAVWMQLGVSDEAAAERARAARLQVVMNRCPAIDHPRFFR